MKQNDAIDLPIDGVLDLHTFQPCEAAAVVADYLEVCQGRGILQVRIIHGKGIGNLRRTVEAALTKLPCVASWNPAGFDAGHWGAVIVRLKPLC
ncbi:MAG TPA: Smr/MutS family protein [Candidatus Rifleibacterium sp.]|nr:Smr/MutS family protein [Candidatus Rifleibacterium sp.]HPT48220.1 Smr/MutS family protein [Candidatus Rifleibacterium sp.]